jgi:hypothetical protein
MVSSISSTKQATQDYIQGITIDLSRAYLKSRLECAQAALDGEVDGMATARFHSSVQTINYHSFSGDIFLITAMLFFSC